MIKELHGKYYYVELTPSLELTTKVLLYLDTKEALKDEEFFYTKHPNGNYVIVSKSKVEAFRGKKYSQWESFKNYAYKLKKEAR